MDEGGARRGDRGQIGRRDVFRLGGAALAAGALAACGTTGGSGGGSSSVVFLSDQLSQTDEAAAMRRQVLSRFSGSVNFIPTNDVTQFIDQVVAQTKTGSAKIDLIGGLQGDFVSLEAKVPLRDMSDVISELSDRDFPPQYLELAKINGAYRFVPWIQATYLMAANKQALAHLPAGASTSSLTYDQLLAWGKALKSATGRPLLGWPASPDGLIKRFFEGYAYPSFTGGVNTTFSSADAMAMWQWFKQTWAVSNPQSPTYSFMQEPLMSGEVWVAWDHAVRLVDALKNQPDNFVVFPAPTGPKGLAYAPVLGGLAIPTTSKNVAQAKELISYLTEPQTTATMLNAEAWFPPIGISKLPSSLAPGVTAEAKAIQQMESVPGAISSKLPVGLGSQSSAYDKVFTDTFTQICINGAPIGSTLANEAKTLQSVLTSAGAACWQPDPPSSGACQVG